MLAVTVASGHAQTVDEIVAKHYVTKGGPEKWKSIQTLKITGSATGQGSFTMVSMFDGTNAWAMNPMSGSDALQEVVGVEGAAIKDQAEFDESILDYRAKGHTVELVGMESVGGTQAHHLKVMRKGQAVQHYYLDANTGLALKITTEAEAGLAVVQELSDYRTVDGVQVAHLVRLTQNGALVGELRIATIEFNVPMDDAWFKGR